jgi:hypothetical protein
LGATISVLKSQAFSLGGWLWAVSGPSLCGSLHSSPATFIFPIVHRQYPGPIAQSCPVVGRRPLHRPFIPRPCEPHFLGACNDDRLTSLTGTGPETLLTWPINTYTLVVVTRQTRPKRGSSDLIVPFQCRNHTISPEAKPKLRDWCACKATRTTQGTHWESDSIKEENSCNYQHHHFRCHQNCCHKEARCEEESGQT